MILWIFNTYANRLKREGDGGDTGINAIIKYDRIVYVKKNYIVYSNKRL
jgi:hypothetical protein